MKKTERKNLKTNYATQKITMIEKFKLIFLGFYWINKYLTRILKNISTNILNNTFMNIIKQK